MNILRTWNVQHITPEQKLDEAKRYRLELQQEIGLDVDRFFAPEDNKRGEFDKSAKFQTWVSSPQSSYLILVGYSDYSIADRQYYCWLSPIVVDLVEEAHSHHRFWACYMLEAKISTDFKNVILSLLAQLLPCRHDKLRDVEIWQTIERLHLMVSTSKSDSDLDASLGKLATYVLNLFDSSHSVYFFLDRVDKCEEDSRLALLQILAKVTQGVQCALKIFVVISGSDWPINARDLKEFGELITIHTEQQERVDDQDDY